MDDLGKAMAEPREWKNSVNVPKSTMNENKGIETRKQIGRIHSACSMSGTESPLWGISKTSHLSPRGMASCVPACFMDSSIVLELASTLMENLMQRKAISILICMVA